MTLDNLLAFTAYAFVNSITPGPNNAMLLASGVNHGFRRTTPHMLGVILGFGLMMLAIALGFGGLFLAFPQLQSALRWVGSAYLLWLAWKIACSGGVNGDAARVRPMSFAQAVAFQWVNPRAWMLAISAAAAYLPPEGGFGAAAALALVSALINTPCVLIWAGCGVALKGWMKDKRHIRLFNGVMALLLVASLYPF